MPTLPHSPAADRNKAPILAHLTSILGDHGSALEIASGTGQHAIWFAAALPHWTWQPTDSDPAMQQVIAERIAESGLTNILPPQHLDVTAERPWPEFKDKKFDAIFCANMLHIAPWEACLGLMAAAPLHLAARGMLITYGPYFESDVPPAPTNLAFDESLRARNPAWGIRALDEVAAVARRAGLALQQKHQMPANNLLLVFQAA